MILKEPATKEYLICRELAGTLVRRGVPVANATISRTLIWNGNEAGTVDVFKTDDAGNFHVPAYYKSLSLGPLSQFVGKTLLEVEYQNDKFDLWYEALTSSKPEELDGIKNMVCEFGVETERVNSSSGLLGTTCKWENMPKEEDPYAL